MNDETRKIEARLDRVHRLRLATEDRFLARQERLEAKAAPLVGELSSGKHYVFPVGGKYFEGTHTECVDYLIKNKWVR